jgi:hypothetical protein
MITAEVLINSNMRQFTIKIRQTTCVLQIKNADWPLLTVATDFRPLQDPSLTQKPTLLSPQRRLTQTTHACTIFTQRIRTKRFFDSPTGRGGGQACSSVPSEQSGCPSQRLDPRIQRVRSHMNSPSAHTVNAHTSSKSLLQVQRDIQTTKLYYLPGQETIMNNNHEF